MPHNPVAFLSYSRSDDRFTRGFITDFRDRLADTVQFKTGRPCEIFQDYQSLGWGADWPAGIDAALAALRAEIGRS